MNREFFPMWINEKLFSLEMGRKSGEIFYFIAKSGEMRKPKIICHFHLAFVHALLGFCLMNVRLVCDMCVIFWVDSSIIFKGLVYLLLVSHHTIDMCELWSQLNIDLFK